MRIPPVTGRIRAEGVVAVPAQVLRVAFAQVGRLVMAADEFRGRAWADRASGSARPPAATGEPAPAAGPGVTRASAATAAPPLPVPNYDELSLASLRARLRYLDAAQLRILVQYERSHAGRAAIVTMFERRMAKLAAQ